MPRSFAHAQPRRLTTASTNSGDRERSFGQRERGFGITRNRSPSAETAFTIHRNAVHVPPKSPFTIDRNTHRERVWINDRYQVALSEAERVDDLPEILHLSIKRRDRAPIHDWRDLQAIKNALTDPEFEGVEIYPAESRRVDAANQFHLWVFADRAFRLPFGFTGRCVEEAGSGGALQRGFTR